MKKIITLLFCVGMTATMFAQAQKVTGSVQDAKTGELLIGVSVLEEGTTNGIITDLDGNFSISVQPGAKLQLSYVGYQTIEIEAKEGNLGLIKMNPEAVALEDVTITGQMARTQQTPVAVSQVTALEIEERLAGQEFPEVLKNTPGVHANGQGGGWGDSEIWMRGFDNTNVATMINGVPMNDMEGGTVYWSNWQGLSDVTSVMQTQRGMGASKLSAPSVGGTINIVTRGIDAKKGGFVQYAMGNDGYNKVAFSVSTGLMKNGWAITVLGSRTWGDGYIQGTGFCGYSYFANISKRINESHQLSLSGFGAPQWHWTRPSGSSGALTLAEWNRVAQYMPSGMDRRQYNPSYGIGKDGKQTGTNYNQYHKPQISLNHIWQIDDNSSLSTTAYVSIGRGFGRTAENGYNSTYAYSDLTRGAYNGLVCTTFRDPITGMFDYAKVQEINAASEYGSELVMCENRNYHNWVGLVSTFDKKFLDCLELTAGIDARWYQGIHTAVISDLFGGSYYMDATRTKVLPENNPNASDMNWVTEKLGVGDVCYRDYTGTIVQEGVFGSLEYSKNNLSAFVNASLSFNHNWRTDRYYYNNVTAKDSTLRLGFTVKGGVNYKFAKYHNVFVNAGFISRAPKYQAIYMSVSTSNAINNEAKNEKIGSVELGYGFENQYASIHVNGYFTEWMDKSMTKYGNLSDANQTEFYMNMTGVNARHMGLEFEAKARPTKWLELSAMLSLGDWKWDSDSVIGRAYDEHGFAMTADGQRTEIGAPDHAWAKVNMKGIHVGGQAQTTANFSVLFKPFKGFRIGAEYTLYDRNYSYYSFSGSNLNLGKEMNIVEPYRCPLGGSMDIRASYSFDMGPLRATLAGNVTNVLNQYYIEKAWSANTASAGVVENTKDNIYFFYNKGRQWNIRLKLQF
ncbi:MAG: carboxypeptidase-like regulatory domain-containing protein [Paludibacteraceae bacterium]|nr:carboxypeptidase-like regulatory domain-containing protein [Paludibacteraceae bacterium]